MAKATPTEKLEKEINQILDKYADQVNDNLALIIQETARVGLNDLKANARRVLKRKRKYVNGWRYDVERQRLYTYSVIHNSSYPGLPHLLEHGHVTKNGTGRTFDPTPAYPHIKEIEDTIIQNLNQRIQSKL